MAKKHFKKKPTIEELIYNRCFCVLESLSEGRKYIHQISYDTHVHDQKIASYLEDCLTYGLVKKSVGVDTRNHEVDYYKLTDPVYDLVKIVEKSRDHIQEYINEHLINIELSE